jgi:GDP-mannose 6-dehydrogenase
LTYKAKSLDLNLPILNSVLQSNGIQIKRAIQLIIGRGKKKIGILGFSFKAGTDDLRESPMVEVIEVLLGKGYDIKIYDMNVNLAKLVGANRDYILNIIPHISKLMVDSIDGVLKHADTIIIGNGAPEFNEILENLHEGQFVIDLVRVCKDTSNGEQYDGICW